MSTVPKFATYDDVLDAPEHLVAEILDGTLYTHPRPAPRHARAAGRLLGKIDDPFDSGRGGPGGWIILIEPELHLGRDVIVPDVAGWRRERIPKLPETAWFELAPDWVCEVLSPSTEVIDRREKLLAYRKLPTLRHYLLVSQEQRAVQWHQRDADGQWLISDLQGSGTLVLDCPGLAVTVSLDDVYGFETYLKAKHPLNNNVKAKIRQQLQFLRDKNVIEFIGRGQYRMKMNKE